MKMDKLTNEERRRQIKRVDDTYQRLDGCCGHTREWDKYLSLNEEEERGHRRFKPDHVQAGLTKAQAVRLFAVKEIFERFEMPHVCRCGWQGAGSLCADCGGAASEQAVFTPTAANFFDIRHSVFAAAAIVKLCQDRICAEFDRLEMVDWLAEVDYCALNQDPRQEVAA
jgi:hypothetical protein